MARGETLAPGFRFHPTDEELVRYYLKRKVTNKPSRFDPISVVDIYKAEPWDLPGMSKLKSRDLEWYFFSALDRKYNNGSKTNRATEKGYWKTTGKDRPVRGGSRTVGMKKTLVFHLGRAPRGQRTNWVMHEYRLTDEELEKAGIVQDAYVLCRIFQKSGTGPKNGEQYGAPFVEEEWDEDEEVDVPFLPCVDVAVPADEMAVADDAYVETNDLDQNLDYASANPDPHSNFYFGDTSNHEAQLKNTDKAEQKPMIGESELQYVSELPDDRNNIDVPGQYEMDSNPVDNHFVEELNHNLDVHGVNFLLDEPYLDATDNLAFDDGLYLEANDLSNPVEADSAGDSGGFGNFEEYLNFFDAVDENLTFDPSDLLGSEDSSSDIAPLSQKVMSEGIGEVLTESPKQSEQIGDSDASTSREKSDSTKYEPDMAVKYSFLKQASHMLGGIPAPPSLASEFPIKDAALRLNAAQASSSVHVTAGMIRIESMTLGRNGMDWSFGKNGTVNIILSFGLPQGDFSCLTLMPATNFLSGKTGSVVSRGWLFLMFFWILILSVSCKIGTHICGKLSGH